MENTVSQVHASKVKDSATFLAYLKKDIFPSIPAIIDYIEDLGYPYWRHMRFQTSDYMTRQHFTTLFAFLEQVIYSPNSAELLSEVLPLLKGDRSNLKILSEAALCVPKKSWNILTEIETSLKVSPDYNKQKWRDIYTLSNSDLNELLEMARLVQVQNTDSSDYIDVYESIGKCLCTQITLSKINTIVQVINFSGIIKIEIVEVNGEMFIPYKSDQGKHLSEDYLEMLLDDQLFSEKGITDLGTNCPPQTTTSNKNVECEKHQKEISELQQEIKRLNDLLKNNNPQKYIRQIEDLEKVKSTEIANLNAKMQSLQAQCTALGDESKKYSSLLNEVNETKKTVQAKNDKINELKKEYDKLTLQANTSEAIINIIKSRIGLQQDSGTVLIIQSEVIVKIEEIMKELKELKGYKKSQNIDNNLLQKNEQLNEQCDSLSQKIRELTSDIEKNNENLAKMQDELNRANQYISEANTKLNQAHNNLAQKESKIDKLSQDLEKAYLEIQELKNKIQQLQKEINALKGKSTDDASAVKKMPDIVNSKVLQNQYLIEERKANLNKIDELNLINAKTKAYLSAQQYYDMLQLKITIEPNIQMERFQFPCACCKQYSTCYKLKDCTSSGCKFCKQCFTKFEFMQTACPACKRNFKYDDFNQIRALKIA
jgi:uncharacterized coiled-coil DUF342 family protein